jgi:sugar-specific transcriptional regulator TrmB
MNNSYKIDLKIDPNILALLKNLGLTEKETTLLLICMGQPETSVDFLAARSGIKRPTIYYVMQTLIQKGLISETRDNGRLKFQATSVDGLQQFAQREANRINSYSEQITRLHNLFPVSSADTLAKVSVEQFSGIEGIKAAIEKALYSQRREWLIVAPASYNNFFGQFDKDYWEYFNDTRRQRKIKARSLWEYEKKLSRQIGVQDLVMRKPRYLPKELSGMFRSIMIVFDNRVLFVTSIGEKTAVVINSEELSAMMRAFFEGLWLGSKPITSDT